MEHDDGFFMQAAIAQAEQAAEEGEIPVGAVLVCHGEIIAQAHNLRETLHDPTAHAEMLCIREAAAKAGDWRMRDCTLYVTLEPCPMCAGAMLMSQLGRCVYGSPDERQGCCGSVYDLSADPVLFGQMRWRAGVQEERCTQVLQSFFAGRRK